jgi:hypothetical protein
VTVEWFSEPRETLERGRLVPWLRHYGVLIALFLVVGIAAGLAYGALGRDTEATTLIVDRAGAVPAREFGVIGQAVFQSDAVVRPAMDELGISTSTERFLRESVALRPVPDARILIVVGRASTAANAREVSSTMAVALVAALEDAGLEGLAVLRGGVTGRSLSRRTIVALGGFSGLWLGVGTAIVLHHVRQPVLSLTTVLQLLDPGRVAILDGTAPWLGTLRPAPRLRKGTRNERVLARLSAQERCVSIVVPGGDGRRRRSVSRRLDHELRTRGGSVVPSLRKAAPDRAEDGTRPTRSLGAERTMVLVADPKTREPELALEALGMKGEEVHLLWIR